MADEIAALQAELAAVAATPAKAVDVLHYSHYSPEGKLIKKVIKDRIEKMEEMRRVCAPFAERAKYVIQVFNYIMANPNIFASEPRLRANCKIKAKEFMENEFVEYRDQVDFATGREHLQAVMQTFLSWTADVLHHNIYYVP